MQILVLFAFHALSLFHAIWNQTFLIRYEVLIFILDIVRQKTSCLNLLVRLYFQKTISTIFIDKLVKKRWT
ncbi:uncharacterized protein LY89DRAFT_239350 [Mollisia scopiformis]|uniref:Secreted protein n=1 Tax=Mollisia scopiformis TaxID=149040 RepID=A0A194WTA7_MOLSC|nr:uncharacterized protein LY89DRAFT_239350 [Mollisia scopiformis]KUJ11190.1 hypothetical protein LY89DRAFT_239350 [Mollisia scopiformis]